MKWLGICAVFTFDSTERGKAEMLLEVSWQSGKTEFGQGPYNRQMNKGLITIELDGVVKALDEDCL